jgi:hypothetical protein
MSIVIIINMCHVFRIGAPWQKIPGPLCLKGLQCTNTARNLKWRHLHPDGL